MEGPILLACGALVCALTQGCAYTRVAPPDINPSTQGETRTINAGTSGVYGPVVTPRNCQGNGLAEVTVHTNWLYSLVSTLTLSLWTPMDVEWKCAKDSSAYVGKP